MPTRDVVGSSLTRGYLTRDERAARGKARRGETPRSSHGDWEPAPDRPDPIGLLEVQAAKRVPELVPIRYGRMAASPFAFYRGAAYIMASDLAGTPNAGIRVQLCGDAHLANFGGFASPERELLFDLVDFDESLPGPWEWDVKRLATSAAVAAREAGSRAKDRTALVSQLVTEYREAIRQFAAMSTLDVWYARAAIGDVQRLLSASQVKQFDKTLEKGRRKDSTRALAKLAVETDGEPRIRSDPPLIVPISELAGSQEALRLRTAARTIIESYRRSLAPDRRRLLERFRVVDMARKVVGVGSVGTRCWVILLCGVDGNDVLFLQAKEAPHSVLEPFTGRSEYVNQGRRVVEGQRLMQAASDIFLGWLREPPGLEDLRLHDLYLRQLWDSKISFDVTKMSVSDLEVYSRLCAWTLARAHARSGDAIAIAGYLGSSHTFDRSIAAFAEAYADQNERDYAALLNAIAAGDIQAQQGV